jgi:hypothetical protein
MDARRQVLLERMAHDAMNAILDACRAEDGTAYVDPDLASQALVACLASIIEADGAVQTRRHIRERSETVARALRLQVEALRRQFDETGEHLGWDAHAVPIQ